MTEEELEKYFQERYAVEDSVSSYSEDNDYENDEENEIIQNGLQPSTKDPNLWAVKCRIGQEKVVGLQLMRKFLTYENAKNSNIEVFFSLIFNFIYIKVFLAS